MPMCSPAIGICNPIGVTLSYYGKVSAVSKMRPFYATLLKFLYRGLNTCKYFGKSWGEFFKVTGGKLWFLV